MSIRRDAEERSIAQQDLGSWMDQMKSNSLRHKAIEKGKHRADAAKSMLAKDETLKHVMNETPGDISSCDAERLRGNKLFAQGEYEDAIQCYSRCLGQKDALASPLVYSNRAMAHLKLKSWSQAEDDATSALQIDALHFKSYQRRCVARLSMGKVRAAMLDVCAAEDSCRLIMDDERNADISVAKTSLVEIQKLRLKVEKALSDAVRRAPRRKMQVTVKTD
ncbi:hypothetical protein ACHAXR_002546 [Thalassiosira sp. AJA248-18]